MLRRLGLCVSEVTVKSNSVESGSVISTSPMPRSRVELGESVTLYVASSRKEYCAEVPSLVGCSLDTAQRKIEELGFVLGEISFENTDDKLRGKVCSQGLMSGISAPKGSVIDICLGRYENYYGESDGADEIKENKDLGFKAPIKYSPRN